MRTESCFYASMSHPRWRVFELLKEWAFFHAEKLAQFRKTLQDYDIRGYASGGALYGGGILLWVGYINTSTHIPFSTLGQISSLFRKAPDPFASVHVSFRPKICPLTENCVSLVQTPFSILFQAANGISILQSYKICYELWKIRRAEDAEELRDKEFREVSFLLVQMHPFTLTARSLLLFFFQPSQFFSV